MKGVGKMCDRLFFLLLGISRLLIAYIFVMPIASLFIIRFTDFPFSLSLFAHFCFLLINQCLLSVCTLTRICSRYFSSLCCIVNSYLSIFGAVTFAQFCLYSLVLLPCILNPLFEFVCRVSLAVFQFWSLVCKTFSSFFHY